MTLAELGAQLREERVGQGLMVEDVAARLKIPARILRAIEEGQIDDLPHTVYTRGFIKGYGLILGYSNERIMELLDSLEDFDEDFSPHKTLERHPVVDAETTGGHRRGLGLLLKLLVITLLAGGGYAYYTHTFRDSGETPSAGFMPETPSPDTAERAASPAPVASDSMATAFPASGSDAATGVSPDMPDAAPVPSASVGPEVLPEPLSAPVVPSSALTETAPGVTQATGPEPGADLAPEGEAVPESEAAPVSTRGFAAADPENPAEGDMTDSATGRSVASEAVLPAGTHQIVLTAEASCWVHANADNTDTREFTLKAGETFAMPFKKSLTLRLGNAGGVKIKYDGRDMPSPGKSGQVKTITFPPAD